MHYYPYNNRRKQTHLKNYITDGKKLAVIFVLVIIMECIKASIA
jgi:hypothetical protein